MRLYLSTVFWLSNSYIFFACDKTTYVSILYFTVQ